MKNFTLHTLLALSVIVQACSSSVYNNTSYVNQKNFNGKTIAILPVDVQLTGKLPAGFSDSKKTISEESESKIIQNQIYSQYLYKSKPGSRKKKQVSLLNVDEVNSKLNQLGIGVRESWEMSPDSLGKLLGVDLVLKIRVKKNRIMSETASFGIGVATAVLGSILSNGTNQNNSISGTAKTYNMYLDATLSEVLSHVVITKFSHEGSASWSQSPDEIIESSGRKIVRRGILYAQK